MADPLTKLQADGTITIDGLQRALKKSFWRPSKEFIYNGVRVQPHNQYKQVGYNRQEEDNNQADKQLWDDAMAWQ